MQIDSLAYNDADTDIGPQPLTDLCKRVLFRQSECQICSDLCPTEAISFSLGPEINNTCINCGLCAIACPTEALENIQNTDQMLLELMEEKADTLIQDYKFHIHCQQAEAKNESSVCINCLGTMTENALVALSNREVQHLLISTGNCNDCQLSKGMELFKQAAARYSVLTPLLSQSQVSHSKPVKISIREKQKQAQPAQTNSRRDFIRSLGTNVVKQAAKIAVDKEKQIKALLQTDNEATETKRPSTRRELLKSLLIESGKVTDSQLLDPQSPWLKMQVDAAHCVGCGVCVNVCPTGALVKEVHDMELTRTINYNLCTNCGVCVEACPQDVIRFEQAYQTSYFTNDSVEVVAKVSLNACAICGEIIPVSEGEVCTTCQKRQVVPMFM
jgi:ferredoxin